MIRTRFLAASDATRGQKTMIWAGRNNHNDPTTVKADIDAMVAGFTGQDYLILGVLNGASEGIGTADYNNIININTYLAATYGAKYYDIRAYLVSQHDQSAQDLLDFADDIVPTSLRIDTQHLTVAGYTKVAVIVDAILDLRAATDGP